MIKNEGGEVVIIDGSEEVYNSGIDRLFHYLPPRVDGSFNRPDRDWSGSGNAPAVHTNDFSIRALPAPTTDIVGLVRFQYSTGWTHLPPNAWFVAGGTFALVLKTFQTISGSWGNYVSSASFATIYADGADLRYREEISLWDHYMSGPNLYLAPVTVHYRIYPAVFS